MLLLNFTYALYMNKNISLFFIFVKILNLFWKIFLLNLESILKNIFVKIYEHEYGPHTDGVYENRGHFTLDKFSGGETEFNVFAVNPFENYLKSMTLQDRRGNLFSDIMDNLATFHIFSIYNVPFKSVR